MRKIHTAESLIQIAHLRNVLQAAGISCQIRNDRLMGIVGEIPFVDCWPELWVDNESDILRARGLIDLELKSPPSASNWTCPSCGETLEGQFSECWRCAPVHD